MRAYFQPIGLTGAIAAIGLAGIAELIDPTTTIVLIVVLSTTGWAGRCRRPRSA